jgi:hypothetical protein
VGFALVAFYLIPAAWEQHWVDIREVMEDPGQTLENNWLFAVHADPEMVLHDQVLRTVSWIVVAMIVATLLALLVCRLRRTIPGTMRWWAPLAAIPVAVLALQFGLSRPLWNLLPELRFLQFPWRWLLVLEPAMAVFVAAAVWPRGRVWRRVVVGLACAAIFAALTAHAARNFYQVCDDEDAVPGMLGVYRAGQGFIGTYEYEPIGADISLIPMGLPAACLTSDAEVVLGKPSEDGVLTALQGNCKAIFTTAAGSGPEHLRIAGTAPAAGFLILRLRTYPAWRVTVNGRAVTPVQRRGDGLMALPVAAGAFTVAADWTTTADVWLARWLSWLSVLALTGLCLALRKPKRARV